MVSEQTRNDFNNDINQGLDKIDDDYEPNQAFGANLGFMPSYEPVGIIRKSKKVKATRKPKTRNPSGMP